MELLSNAKHFVFTVGHEFEV